MPSAALSMRSGERWRGDELTTLRLHGGRGITFSAREPWSNAMLAVVMGIFLGGLAIAVQVRPKTSTDLAVVGVVVAIACVIAGNPRRFMLALVLLDIPLEWGKNLSWNNDLANVGAIPGVDISLTTIALAGLYMMWALGRGEGKRERLQLRLRPALPLIAYVGISALSLLGAHNKTLSSYELVMLSQILLLFIYVASTVRTRSDVTFIVTVLMGGLLVESLVVIAVSATGTSPHFLGLRNRVDPTLFNGRVGGTVGSPNDAAAYLCLMLSLAIGVLVSPLGGWARRLALTALPLGVIALIVTGSRGGWISFAIACFLIGIWAVRRGIIAARSGIVVALAVGLLIIPFWGTITHRLTGNDNGSAHSRVAMVALAEKMISAHPVTGLGINNVGINIPNYAGPQFAGQWLYTIHDKYLLVWAEAGIGALLVFVWFLGMTLYRGWRCARSEDRLLAPLAVAMTAGVAGQLFHMGVDIFQSKPEVEGLWLTAALIMAMELIVRSERRSTIGIPPRRVSS